VPPAAARHVVVLAPMPLEMQAITTAFGLAPTAPDTGAPWTGQVGDTAVTALHIGMGPPRTRAAITALFDQGGPGGRAVDHVMIAGICGGLDPDLEVGTVLNPEVIVDHTSGTAYHHAPPGDGPVAGKATLDVELSKRFFAQGFLGVDMESAAVAEMCEPRGLPWSVYRCIGDRWFDGLLDERVVAATNADGSGDEASIRALLAADPAMTAKLRRLAEDTSRAARLAAEAAVRGCLALGT